MLDFFQRAIVKRSAWANRRAPGTFAEGGAVITHVALHHQFKTDVHLRNAKGTGQNAIVAGNAAGFAGRLHHAIRIALDRIGRTYLGASGRIAVHADHGNGLWREGAIDVFEMNHRVPLVRIAFAACLDARLASNAAIGIDKKVLRTGMSHGITPLLLRF
jgi:hypothetical protein